MEAYHFITDNFNGFVSAVASILGVLILLVGIWKFYKASDTATEKWPVIGVLAVGAFLLVGSQYKSFKVSATGLEALRNDVAEAADAAANVAAQTAQAATAVEETQQQVNALTTALEQARVLPSAATAPIRARLQTRPRVDLDKLNAAQRVLARIRVKSALQP